MLRHALALLFPSGAESMQSLSRLGGGLLSKSSKIIQRPFLLQKAAARLSSTRIPSTSIKTPEVLLAFERARLDKLPGEVRERYVEQNLEFDRYSDHTSKLVREGRREGAFEGRREGAFEIARKMLVRGRPLEEIVEDSGLTKVEVEVMKTAASHEDRCNP
jgi:predicted transposase YdaD